jgi:hypothetical protein
MGRCIGIETARARRAAPVDSPPLVRLRGMREMPPMRLQRDNPSIWWSLTAWLWCGIRTKIGGKSRPLRRNVLRLQSHRNGK